MARPILPKAKVSHGEVLRFLWKHVRRHRALLAVLLGILFASTALHLVQPFFYKMAVDLVIGSEVRSAAVLRNALFFVVLGVLCGAVHLTLHEVAARILGWIETRALTRAHAEVFAHVQRLSTQFHVNAFAGATARKIGRGTDSLETIMDRLWFNFLPLAATTIGFVIVFVLFAPIMGIAIVGGTIVYAAVSITLSLYQARYHSWTDEQDTKVTASMVDALAGNAAVKAFGAELREDERHGAVLREWRDRLWKTWGVANIVTWTQFMMITAIELVLMLVALLLWYRGDFTAGSFIVVISYIGRLWGYLFDIGQQVRNYLQAVAHAEEMVGLLKTPLGVADREGASSLRITRGAIEFDHVTFRYPEHQEAAASGAGRSENTVAPVFRDFTVSIRPGEKIALVGHSGGGKSTFVKLLLRLYDVTEGTIRLDGEDIGTVTQESLRTSIALVPQDPILFHRSIAENIAYARPDASLAEIERAATLAHAHEFISLLPKGYDTLVGERGVKLSGGERQRVAIARAIIADTPILVLDEATSSLDSLSEGYIQDALAKLMEGRTTIAIAHRLSTIKRVDRILVIEHGRILEEGPHADLVKRPHGVYRALYDLQAGGFLGE